MAALSIILGIISLFTCTIPVIGFGVAILALIVSIIATLRKSSNGEGAKKTGLVLSIISTIISFIIIVFILTAASVVLDVGDGLLDTVKMVEAYPEVAGLVSDLTEEYFEIIMYNKFSNDDITIGQAEQRYIDILMNEHRELYNEGYDVKVNGDMKFEIIIPTEKTI